jgi:hypothetical protein
VCPHAKRTKPRLSAGLHIINRLNASALVVVLADAARILGLLAGLLAAALLLAGLVLTTLLVLAALIVAALLARLFVLAGVVVLRILGVLRILAHGAHSPVVPAQFSKSKIQASLFE